jgi:hypothetical protein
MALLAAPGAGVAAKAEPARPKRAAKNIYFSFMDDSLNGRG